MANLALVTKLVPQTGNNSQPEIVRPAEVGLSRSQPGETLAKIVLHINENMGTMASLLQTIVPRQDSRPQMKRRHSPHDSSGTDSESEDNDHETSSRQLSISPSDEDINELPEESNSNEVEVTAKTAEPKEEGELLKPLDRGWLY